RRAGRRRPDLRGGHRRHRGDGADAGRAADPARRAGVHGGPDVTAALAASKLVKEYAGARALGPLTLTVGQGSLVALSGHNGAGKSTLLRLAAGLLDRTGGELTICGERPGSMTARGLV